MTLMIGDDRGPISRYVMVRKTETQCPFHFCLALNVEQILFTAKIELKYTLGRLFVVSPDDQFS